MNRETPENSFLTIVHRQDELSEVDNIIRGKFPTSAEGTSVAPIYLNRAQVRPEVIRVARKASVPPTENEHTEEANRNVIPFRPRED